MESEPTTESAALLSESKATPEESLENSYQVLRDALAHDALEAIKQDTTAFSLHNSGTPLSQLQS